MPKPLVPGIYAPTQVFFHPETEDLDVATIAKHAVRLARAGVVSIVTNGSNGEAVYLSAKERASVTRITRDALDEAGFCQMPLVSGASDQSVRGTIDLCKDAAEAGADAVLVLSPSFFKWAMDGPTIERYYCQVADASPLPVVIYNYPGAVAGIDLDSEMLSRLSQHPNIIGTKFTCGNVGKLARVAADTHPVSDLKTQSAEGQNSPYFAFAGVADFIIPSLGVGASGAIVGAANIFPKASVRVYDLVVQGKHDEALKAQLELAKADWSLTKRAIPGFKALLNRMHGYGGHPRQPMGALGLDASDELYNEVEWMIEIEANLQDKSL